MDNIYFDVGNLLVKNLLLNDINPDIVSYIYMSVMYIAFFIGIGLIASPFVLSFVFHKEIKNENAFILLFLGVIMLILVWSLSFCRREHDMNQALIQSKDEIHMLAKKHNVDDKITLEIAQDIVFCEPSSLKYNLNSNVASHVTTSTTSTIQCENKNYYGKSLAYEKVETNLNLVQRMQHPELFIMKN